MGKKDNLTRAKNEKNDEFYTQINDIENELKHYRKHFKDKIVFCNCDDPTESNFWRYFHLNFEFLGLRKLITTHYDKSEPTYKMEYEGGNDNDWSIGKVTKLSQNGDFRSPECIELLKEADLIVTNPPFSLFREYVAQLMEYDKKFIIIGNKNAITYREIFPLLKDNKMWLGNGFKAGNAYFRVKDGSGYAKGVYDPETKLVKFRNCCWFTNLDHNKRHEKIDLVEKYSSEKYLNYDNYNAINVDKVLDIPCDYAETMGVPITFLDKYNPEQFKILGLANGRDEYEEASHPIKRYINPIQYSSNGKQGNGSKVNTGPTIKYDYIYKYPYYTADNVDGYLEVKYARILICRKDYE